MVNRKTILALLIAVPVFSGTVFAQDTPRNNDVAAEFETSFLPEEGCKPPGRAALMQSKRVEGNVEGQMSSAPQDKEAAQEEKKL